MTDDVVTIEPGTGLRLLVDETVYETKTVYPLVNSRSVHDSSEQASDMLLHPMPDGGVDGKDYPEVELQFVGPNHGHAFAVTRESPEPERATPDENRALFERDLALRQAKIAQSYLQVIRIALNENRPLEALNQVNNALDELEEELESIEELQEASADD